MDGSEPLPVALRIDCGEKMPPISEVRKLDEWIVSAAFSPDGKRFYVSGRTTPWDTGPTRRKAPSAYRVGSDIKGKGVLCGLGVDHKGRVYAQRAPANDSLSPERRPAGDILVWDSLAPKGDAGELPAQDRKLELNGVVRKMIASSDGKYLYFLDPQNRRVGRINAEKGKIDKLQEDLSADAVSMCLTADGKRIYCLSARKKIDVVDAATFRLLATLSFDKGVPQDIAATNAGLVLVAGPDLGDGNASFLLDLTKGLTEKAAPMALPVGSASVVRRAARPEDGGVRVQPACFLLFYPNEAGPGRPELRPGV